VKCQRQKSSGASNHTLHDRRVWSILVFLAGQSFTTPGRSYKRHVRSFRQCNNSTLGRSARGIASSQTRGDAIRQSDTRLAKA
jgi:hypothetical protein